VIDLSPFKLIIFDKDGTLIDFGAMWGGWVESLAARLETATGRPLAAALYAAMDYDATAKRTLAGGRLAVTPMAGLRALTGEVLLAQGLSASAANEALDWAWHIPDPAATARSLTDLPRLFGALRRLGLKIAVATSDDRAPTVATLVSLGVADLVDVLITADDGVPLKPNPEMVWAACRATGVEPWQAVVVGDAVPEMEMARAAGAGRAVGVTSGVSDAAQLAAFADVVVSSVQDLIA
jgi:phosphoglycolate phosphatase